MSDFGLKQIVDKNTLLEAYKLMLTAQAMADVYDVNRRDCKYVHATSRGHEAIQVAAGLQLKTCDYASIYYRDDALLLAMGLPPYKLMLQLLAKADDPFSGGRNYYAHAALRSKDFPTIPTQSSATGMQSIQAVGIGHGLLYKKQQSLLEEAEKGALVLCSLGDGAMTEGEVAEALQYAALKSLPVLFLVQDNHWGLSATSEEFRTSNAYEYAAGFKGLERMEVDGSDFIASYLALNEAYSYVRNRRKPLLLRAVVPLLGHHTSGVRKESYRTEGELAKSRLQDPIIKLGMYLQEREILSADLLQKMEEEIRLEITQLFEKAKAAAEPDPESLSQHIFAPTPIQEERGIRQAANAKKVFMVEALLHGMEELLAANPMAIYYGQDIGARLGGVFREAHNLAKKFGKHRVFNTAIQEALIVGSTAGMAAVGVKPIVEIQFADYFWPAMNQLVTELAKSCYLSKGAFPIQALIRVPIGAYGGGGPYHSASIESTLLSIHGIKVVYPSNAADAKGLLKAAFYDPNPVLFLEHKGLYWSKVLGTGYAQTLEPSADYILPLGKANVVQEAAKEALRMGESMVVISYGMGVHWAINASLHFPGQIEILDLRSLNPLDETSIFEAVKRHGKALVLTEEPVRYSFAESLAGLISRNCFQYLDAPVEVVGAENLPAIPLNKGLEKAMLPNAWKVAEQMSILLAF